MKLSSIKLCLIVAYMTRCCVVVVVGGTKLEQEVGALLRRLTNESTYNKDIRPNFGESPVAINVTILVNSISSVSETNMDFTMDFYFRQYWRDKRLAFNASFAELTLAGDFISRIWLPDTFIRNSRSISTHVSTSSAQTNTLIRLQPSGDVLYSTRLTSTSNCPMDLSWFPGDTQNCKLIFASYGYSTKDVRYYWAPGNKSFVLSDLIFLPTFQIKKYHQGEYKETFSTGTFGRLVCDIYFARSFGYYMYQIYVPAFLIVVISWVPFWLDREDNHARVGLGVTTVLTMTTLTTNTNESLPKISYIKAIDVYLFACFLMVFLSLIEYATVGFSESIRQYRKHRSVRCKPPKDESMKMEMEMEGKRSKRDSKITFPASPAILKDSSRIDRFSRIVFPSVFLLFNFVYAGVFIYATL